MTDFTHHTPRLLSEADAAADLAGVARPSKGLRLLYDYGQAITESGDSEEIYMNYAAAREYIKAMESERDALAGRVAELESEVLDQCRLNGMGAERELALMGRVRELEAERDAAAKRAPDFAEFVDETDSTLEMVKRTFGNRGTPPDMLEGFATLTMVEQLLKRCEQVRAALTPTPESKP